MTPQEKLLATALAEVGYIGHKSAEQLDSPTANGGGKYTKYARDLDAPKTFYNGPKQGFDWCDCFVDWCFVKTFGRELAQRMIFQPDRSAGAGTGYSLGYYKAKGRLFMTPHPGDQIFFGDAKSTWHTGIVTRVTGGTVCTVEGNAGSPLGVHEFRYQIGNKIIKGYGRPDWSLAGGATTVTVPGASTPAAPPAATQTPSVKVGDIVEFTGTQHYSSANGNTSFLCKPGKAKITHIAKGKHPYHLERVAGGTATVYGWVDEKDIKV